MRLESIKITNFKSIKDTLELDFKDVNGFWKINGIVGSGKTSIGEAILFGLFGDIKGKNNKDLITWGESTCNIELSLISRNNSIYINRTISRNGFSKLIATSNGENIISTNKRDLQNILETDYYDVSRLMIELLCIISFNNFKSLATLNSAGTKEFLDKMFGFDTLTQYSLNCKDAKSLVDSNIKKLQLEIKNKDSQIERIKNILNTAFLQGDTNDLKKDIELLTEKFKLERSKKNKNFQDLESKLSIYKDRLRDIKSLGTAKAKEIDLIKSGKCPVCGADIDSSNLSVVEKERELLLGQYNTESNNIKSVQDDINRLKEDISILESEYKQSVDEINSKIIKLTEQEKWIGINNDNINILEQEKKVLESDLKLLLKDSADWESLISILSNEVRESIIESFIPILNNSINSYTQQLRIPYTIEFDRKFKCHIKIANDIEIPVNSLSTGQLKSVDICIILGVVRSVLSTVNFNIIFLDELVSNMHSDLRNIVCQVLKENTLQDQTIFMITHVDIDNDMFDGVIDCDLVNSQRDISISSFTINKFKRYF